MATRRPTEHRNERGHWHLRHIANREKPTGVEFFRCGRADSPEPLHWQWMQEIELVVGFNHEETVRLRYRARHLGEELRASDADGDGETDAIGDGAPQLDR